MISPKDYKVRPIAASMQLTHGRPNDAILLCEIWDFYVRSKASRKNLKVIVQTDEQLCERTGLSLSQLRRAKQRLVGAGLIETCQGISAKYHGGRNVSHLHMPNHVVRKIETLILGMPTACITEVTQSCPTQPAQECATLLNMKEVSKSNPSTCLMLGFDENAEIEKLKELFGE